MSKSFIVLFFLAISATVSHAAKPDTVRLYQIDDVVVTTYRSGITLRDAPNQVEVVSRDKILRTPSINFADIVKKVTSAETSDMQGLTGGIEFRGFAPAATGTNTYSLMLMDGVPMGTRNAAATMLSGISSIEILKGPFSALYGSGAMGGVINAVSMQSRGDIRGGIAAGYGSFDTWSAQAWVGGSFARKFDFDLMFDYYKQGDNYTTGKHNLLNMTPYEDTVMVAQSYGREYGHTALDKKRAVLRAGWDIAPQWRLNFYNDFYITGDAQGNGMFWGLYEQTEKEVKRNYHRLDLTGDVGCHSLRLSPYFSNESSDYLNIFDWGDTRSEYVYRTYGFLAQDVVSIGRQSLIFGFDNYTQKYTSTQADGSGAPQPPYQPDYLNAQTGVFVQANLSLFEGRLTAVAGLRYDNTLFKTLETPELDVNPTKKSYNALNPNLAARFKFLPWLSLHASAGRAYLAPDAFKTTGDYVTQWGTYKGNPDLKPEISVSFDLGITLATTDKALTADVTLFDTRHDNLIVYDYSNSGYTTFANSNKATMRGLDMMAQFDLGRMLRQRWSLIFSGTYTRFFHSEVVTPFVTGERKYLSRTKGSAGVEFACGKFSANILGRYIGSKIDDNFVKSYDASYNPVPFVTKDGVTVRASLVNDAEVRLPDFFVVDFYAGYNITSSLSVGVKVANALDENYMERDGYYMPGRWAGLNASFTF